MQKFDKAVKEKAREQSQKMVESGRNQQDLKQKRFLSERQRDHDSFVKGRELTTKQMEYSL